MDPVDRKNCVLHNREWLSHPPKAPGKSGGFMKKRDWNCLSQFMGEESLPACKSPEAD